MVGSARCPQWWVTAMGATPLSAQASLHVPSVSRTGVRLQRLPLRRQLVRCRHRGETEQGEEGASFYDDWTLRRAPRFPHHQDSTLPASTT